ncbi:hypothetical protein ELD05_09180 [Caldicellulosiruptor changbaiensis]|uniref:Uncharacterized protein n=2 Tax=Caldicellulosiruptor TaxID=44000 RepID=A0A3T0D6T1_9FIRM|nr:MULTISPECIES: hypothetical protein [Caldicellulosiruptor]AZT90797.1 hypothetical protein ELD05_09180 [Caldicellulosiruptor changbaiensis]BCS80780.1 hypothetical protein CaldiYA01_07400 [Caldicellulosiruptor diazotrophicus]
MERRNTKKRLFGKISSTSKKILLIIGTISVIMLLLGIKFYFLSLHYVSDKIDLKTLSQGLLQNSLYIFIEGLAAAIIIDYLAKTKN